MQYEKELHPQGCRLTKQRGIPGGYHFKRGGAADAAKGFRCAGAVRLNPRETVVFNTSEDVYKKQSDYATMLKAYWNGIFCKIIYVFIAMDNEKHL